MVLGIDDNSLIANMRPFFRVAPRKSVTISRPFTTARQFRLKEDKERDPEEAEQAKQEAMNKTTEGSHRGVASSSEEDVGADREKVRDHDKHMEELQKQTAQKSEEEHPKGNS